MENEKVSEKMDERSGDSVTQRERERARERCKYIEKEREKNIFSADSFFLSHYLFLSHHTLSFSPSLISYHMM